VVVESNFWVSPCSHGGKPCHAGASSGTAAVVGPSFSPDSATRNYSHHQSNCCGCRHAGCLSTNRSSRGLDHRRAPCLPHHPRRVPYPSGGHVPTHRRDAWCTDQPDANPTPRCLGRVRTRRRGRAPEVSRTGGKGRARLMISRSDGACRARHRRTWLLLLLLLTSPRTSTVSSSRAIGPVTKHVLYMIVVQTNQNITQLRLARHLLQLA
jgi:hypothetical protein